VSSLASVTASHDKVEAGRAAQRPGL